MNEHLILVSTRSHANGDAWRDMDGFDVHEERRRVQQACLEVKKLCGERASYAPFRLPEIKNYNTAEELARLLEFIAEGTLNIEEWEVRGGTKLKRGAELKDE